MLIKEILNPIHKQITPSKGVRNRHHKGAIARMSKRIGYGAYAHVYASKNPLEVIKKTTLDDGFQYYAKGVLEYNKTHGKMNPYFPIFYRVNEFKDVNSEYSTMHIRMEKLNEIGLLEAEDLKEMIVKMFGSSEITRSNPHWDAYIEEIVYRLDSYCRHNNKPNYKIVDFRLEEALDFIIELRDRNMIAYDFHDGNIMWRRSSQGPQLVITDPFVFDDKS